MGMLPEDTDLFAQICSFENLFLAYRKARKGKRGKTQVGTFEFNQEDELLQLQEELTSKTWTPGAYHSFYIHDPKRRLISAAPFRDLKNYCMDRQWDLFGNPDHVIIISKMM